MAIKATTQFVKPPLIYLLIDLEADELNNCVELFNFFTRSDDFENLAYHIVP